MISEKRLVKTFMELARIESLSLNEKECAVYLEKRMRSLGLKVKYDKAHKHIGGNVGNLYAYLKGRKGSGAIMFSAHMDTVGPAENVRPVRRGDKIVSQGATILGADDKGGIAVIVEMLEALIESKADHPDIEVVFTIAEEIGLKGAKHIDPGLLSAKIGFIFDSEGSAGSATSASPYYNGFTCTVRGRTAHAGVEPEKGRSALVAAAEMVAKFKQGRLDKKTTANIGVFTSGGAKNIVADLAVFEGEIRSHSLSALQKHTALLQKIVKEVAAARKVKAGLDISREFDGFDLKSTDAHVRKVTEIMRSLKLKPRLIASGGGSDANIFNKMGIPALNLATGTEGLHTTSESLSVKDAVRSAELALAIAVNF